MKKSSKGLEALKKIGQEKVIGKKKRQPGKTGNNGRRA